MGVDSLTSRPDVRGKSGLGDPQAGISYKIRNLAQLWYRVLYQHQHTIIIQSLASFNVISSPKFPTVYPFKSNTMKFLALLFSALPLAAVSRAMAVIEEAHIATEKRGLCPPGTAQAGANKGFHDEVILRTEYLV
ncbi:hypothetical protein FKW77_004506 [Venturia effusa]|uniref:Uncharacterized protein n=1 Tax=Venturia effusa TaxID=50376 RepID=A0A517LH25_9PEZI|nr:hypothetical protein FKW77_004506 [Venturia effusa]